MPRRRTSRVASSSATPIPAAANDSSTRRPTIGTARCGMTAVAENAEGALGTADCAPGISHDVSGSSRSWCAGLPPQIALSRRTLTVTTSIPSGADGEAMPAQVTTRAQVNGYRFLIRHWACMIRGDSRMIHDPARPDALLVGGSFRAHRGAADILVQPPVIVVLSKANGGFSYELATGYTPRTWRGSIDRRKGRSSRASRRQVPQHRRAGSSGRHRRRSRQYRHR
jgi:hypothetical protein